MNMNSILIILRQSNFNFNRLKFIHALKLFHGKRT